MVKSIICTLFEGHYHYGVAALINSLHTNGFKGKIYIGYKGELPEWVKGEKNTIAEWHDVIIMKTMQHIHLHFLPITTGWHLSNYKPDFFLQVIEKIKPEFDLLFYFDPDIVIAYPWDFFESWAQQGVCLVQEIAAVAMPSSHPVRHEWKKIIRALNYPMSCHLHAGLNSGFCGVSKTNISFLKYWSNLLHHVVRYNQVNPSVFAQTNAGHAFHFADQDTFNMAAMCYDGEISEMGPDAMSFINGGWKVMAHATGFPKPWKKNCLLYALKGFPPSIAEKAYWKNADGFIKVRNSGSILLKKLYIKLASFIGRFYRRY
ncbi:hypothetical protein [Parafilimonas sp.]|uniref:hypothetical protein n=1 Tax=Parafilimonas sp. TaxID=1969739 RepID=UPI0039E5867B